MTTRESPPVSSIKKLPPEYSHESHARRHGHNGSDGRAARGGGINSCCLWISFRNGSCGTRGGRTDGRTDEGVTDGPRTVGCGRASVLRWRLYVTHTFFSRAIQAASPFSRQSDGERFRRTTRARQLHTFHVETTMVIRLNMISDDSNKVLRRTAAKAAKSSKADNRNTRAEFKRLKTILPSIRKKENVSKLDIILEAIKYIDDLTEQLEHRLDEEDVVVDAKRSESENIVLAAPDVQREAAAAVMALAAEAQMTSSASGFYSDESPGENRLQYTSYRS